MAMGLCCFDLNFPVLILFIACKVCFNFYTEYLEKYTC